MLILFVLMILLNVTNLMILLNVYFTVFIVVINL